MQARTDPATEQVATRKPVEQIPPTNQPRRLLMVPGPTNLHPRVQQALLTPMMSHKDPVFLATMDAVAERLRTVFQTRNRVTMALPATGGSGMEASLMNLLEPGDTVLVGVAGFFAQRMVEIARRLGSTCGVRLATVEAPWGEAIPSDTLRAAIDRERPRVVALVHGETSTGVLQPLDGLADVVHRNGGFLVVDCVPTLGGQPVLVDEWGIDVCYSGSQKCLSAPPGLCPITVSDAAIGAIQSRRQPVASWYLDLSLHARYWDAEHIYHHTGPVLQVCALAEALQMIVEEGLEPRFARHRLHARALRRGLEALDLQLFVRPEDAMTTVVTVRAPDGISAHAIQASLLDDFNIEVGIGLGPYTDRLWRIGVMGHSAQRENVMLLLGALQTALARAGHRAGDAMQAADASYTEPLAA